MSPILLTPEGAPAIYLHHVVLWAGIVLCAAWACASLCKKTFSGRTSVLFVSLSVLLGFFCAHLGYGLLRIEYALYDRSPLWLVTFWDGGYMLYGGLLGVVLAAFIAAKASRASAVKLMDAVAPAGALMIAFARLAEGLSGAFFGDYVEEGTALARFPFAVYDSYYEGWSVAVFMAAVVIALILTVFLLIKKPAFAGDRTLLLLGLYASAQVVLESMRFDDFLRWGFIRCSQVFSAVVLAFVLLAYCRRACGRFAKKRIAVWCTFAVCAALVLVLEFAVDGKIEFLSFLTPASCHALMAIVCAVFAALILTMRRISLAKAE